MLLVLFIVSLTLLFVIGVHEAAYGRLWLRKAPQPQPEVQQAPSGQETQKPPRVGCRRWARAMYYNGIISMEELNTFYVDHPDEE